MALIKCPECGGNVSDTIEACPHCGFKLKKEKNILGKEITAKNEDVIVVVRRDRSQGNGVAGTCIILGILLLPLIIGLGLLIGGIDIMSTINKNNQISKELIYFDKTTNEFICYDVKGRTHRFKAEDFTGKFKVASGAAIKNRAMINKGKTTLGCANINDIGKIDEIIAAL